MDIAPDGKRFAVLVPANTEVSKPSTHVRILFHFAEEVENGKLPRIANLDQTGSAGGA